MSDATRFADLEDLELLAAVARTGSIGAAGRERGISQPSASARLRGLERRVGLVLLHRGPWGARLTGDGELVVDWSRHVLDAAQAFTAGVLALRREQDSRLRLAASFTVAEYLLPRWIAGARQRRPDIGVSLVVANSARVSALVLAGEVDLGFVEGPRVPPGLRARLLVRDELVVIVGVGHPWARRAGPVGLAELAGTALIEREEGSGTRQALDVLLGDAGAGRRPPLMELSSTTAIKTAVAAGAGAAVLSSLTVAAEVAAGSLVVVPVEGPVLQRRLRAVWRAGARLCGPALELLAVVNDARRPVSPGRGGPTRPGVASDSGQRP